MKTKGSLNTKSITQIALKWISKNLGRFHRFRHTPWLIVAILFFNQMKSNEIKWNQMKSNEIKWNLMKSNENWRDSELAVRSIRKHGQRIIYVESQASSRGKGGRGKGETAQKWQVERVHLAGVSSNTHGNKALKNLQQMVAPIRSNREMNQWFHGICLFLSLIKIGTKTATIRCWRQHGCYRRHDDSTNCYLYFVIE